MNSPFGIVASIILAAGIAAGGYFIGDGFLKARHGDRFVTVKGVSERDVEADLAVWQIPISASGNNLSDVQAKIDQDLGRIVSFLKAHGISPEETSRGVLRVEDLLQQNGRDRAPDMRYVVNQSLTVRTPKVKAVGEASQAIGDLVKEGVLISWSQGPQYIFTGLNGIKPSMIAEATKEARKAAEQFAKDSGSRVAAIRRANQGVFSITARTGEAATPDSSEPDKTVRVVSTIDFYLED